MTPHVLMLGAFAPSLTGFRGPLIRELVRRGWRVTAAAPDMDDATRRALQAMGAEVATAPLSRTGMNPLAELGGLVGLRRLFRRVRPDVILPYTSKPVIWGALAAARLGSRRPRVVAMITGLGYAFTPPARPSLRHATAAVAARVLYRMALRRTDRVLFQNPDDLALFTSLGLLPASTPAEVTAGSGVDLEVFAPAPLPPAPVFLMVSRLLGAKGVREYASAAVRLKARHPGAVFRLAGWIDPGPDAVAPEEVDRWIAGGVDYLGRLDDVRPALAEASVFVLPSWREGASRSVLEAMAMNRPVVTTDAPGCRETVTDGVNGRLVPVRDVDALAGAMEAFILDPSLAPRMGVESLWMARERYDVRLVNAQVIAALQAALSPPRSAPISR